MLHPGIRLGSVSNIQGKGLFTTTDILPGEVVWRLEMNAPRYKLSDIESWSEPEKADFYTYGFQCGGDMFVIPHGIDKYMNHSCDPNTWWVDSNTLGARRHIYPGEEVTYDYSSCDILLEYELDCSCGSPICRGTITNVDYLDLAWQKRFGKHLPEHVLAAIKIAERQEG